MLSQSSAQGVKGWKAIESISFKLDPRNGAKFIWTFPFENFRPSQVLQSYQLTHDHSIDVSIEWPAYCQRSVQGSYRGILQVGADQHHVRYIISLQALANTMCIGCGRTFYCVWRPTAIHHDIFEPVLRSRKLQNIHLGCLESLQCG